ncbi:acetyl-CoA carboxylase biotin carboxyl carrier protein subunit [Oceanibacterium hippocampi]|uniref:Putative acetyl-CoA carboxylase biotin carboxyl carrier protein subunit n=1 Tax=Oceanibacterium hippocampi TaxID=745714 RepID=A0A1Y5TA00_9PROT|nr:acetyl-CoA carboxylase biotin carboxyl carrier protein subunit [Oceanibacterium hippocampi]SLN57251.1 putative acetyl-CoA carboxylase biotin carboxyl carrier protein subunit [Oceanibacterium hippocampi]
MNITARATGTARATMPGILLAAAILTAGASGAAAQGQLSPDGAQLAPMVVGPGLGEVNRSIETGGDTPSATYVTASTPDGQRLKRDRNGFWTPWSGDIDALEDNGFAADGDTVTYKILKEDLSGTFFPISVQLAYRAGGAFKFGAFTLHQQVGASPVATVTSTFQDNGELARLGALARDRFQQTLALASRSNGAGGASEGDGGGEAADSGSEGAAMASVDDSGSDRDSEERVDDPSLGSAVVAPIGGSVIAISVTGGANVVTGDVLVVLRNEEGARTVVAPGDGTVASVAVVEGETVEAGATLVVLQRAGG